LLDLTFLYDASPVAASTRYFFPMLVGRSLRADGTGIEEEARGRGRGRVSCSQQNIRVFVCVCGDIRAYADCMIVDLDAGVVSDARAGQFERSNISPAILVINIRLDFAPPC
jgi:hypothetical protein